MVVASEWARSMEGGRGGEGCFDGFSTISRSLVLQITRDDMRAGEDVYIVFRGRNSERLSLRDSRSLEIRRVRLIQHRQLKK